MNLIPSAIMTEKLRPVVNYNVGIQLFFHQFEHEGNTFAGILDTVKVHNSWTLLVEQNPRMIYNLITLGPKLKTFSSSRLFVNLCYAELQLEYDLNVMDPIKIIVSRYCSCIYLRGSLWLGSVDSVSS